MNLREGLLLLDGATGTELGRRGADISLPLWSARAMVEAPDVLRQIHLDYLHAGADLITANTFRTHRRSLAKAGLGERSGELTRRAVELARDAVREAKTQATVVGSVAPLEDCYRPELAPAENVCQREHGEMIEALLESGADAVLIETMNCVREARAAARVAQSLAPRRWMISFCIKSQGAPGELLSGESVLALAPDLGGALAVGVNCVAAPMTLPHVELLREHFAGQRIIAYANVGQEQDGEWLRTDAVDPRKYAEYAQRWLDAGATIVGGCCGTTPEHIRTLTELRRATSIL